MHQLGAADTVRHLTTDRRDEARGKRECGALARSDGPSLQVRVRATRPASTAKHIAVAQVERSPRLKPSADTAQALKRCGRCTPVRRGCVRDAVCDAAACCMVRAASGRSARCSPGCGLHVAMRYATRCNAACCMLRRRRRSFFARPRLLEEGRVFCVPVAASLVHPEGRRRFIGGAMPASARSSQQDAGIGEVRGSVGCAIHVYIYINSPKGPEPALGFFEKKTLIVPLLSR